MQTVQNPHHYSIYRGMARAKIERNSFKFEQIRHTTRCYFLTLQHLPNLTRRKPATANFVLTLRS